MDRWAPLFSKIVESSIWDEDDAVCKVWVTMLALKDSDQVVRKNLYQLGRAARKSEEEVEAALKVLASPDKRRKGQENEGRRIEKVDGGWLVLNGGFYEEEMRKISRQVYQAKWAREKRAREKIEAAMKGDDGKVEVGVKNVNDYMEKGMFLQ